MPGSEKVLVFALTAVALLLAGIIFARAPRANKMPTLLKWIFAIAATILLLAGVGATFIALLLHAGL